MSEINITTMTNEEKMALVCLYYAQLHSKDERYKGKCHQVLHYLAEKFGRKYGNIKNDKDAYDALFDNSRQGWHDRPLEQRSKFLFDFYEKYKSHTIGEFEEATEKTLDGLMNSEKTYFSIKTKDEKTVKAILSKNSNIEFDGLNILQDSLHIGQLVFIVLGGDKPAWDTGLVGMGVISEEPYDVGYAGKNYKIKVDIKLLLDKAIKREDLVPYRDTYGIIGIAPIVKWEPNQAISQLPEKSAVALMRAMLEISPSINDDLSSLIDIDTLKRIKGATTMFVPVEVNYQENIKDSIKELESFEDDDKDDSEEVADPYTKEDFLKDVFIDSDEYDILCELLENKKNIILQGAPGVGKTFVAKRLAYSILGFKYDSCIKMVQFHQSYSYEDFVMGFRPTETGFTLSSGPFYDFCELARKDDRKHFFIIDEINRGNLSKIFGELLMLIESDKRLEKVNILYKNEEFGIPDNVYIIGMMNTADRGLAMLDYALRRRFSFYEMKPAFDSFGFKSKISSSEQNNIEKIISIIKELNQAICDDDTLGKGFMIGHSYFCYDKPISAKTVKMIVEYEILPLINEYWFDEPSKVEQWTNKLRGALK